MVMFLLIMNYVAALIVSEMQMQVKLHIRGHFLVCYRLPQALQLFRGDISDTSLIISFDQVYNGFIGMYQACTELLKSRSTRILTALHTDLVFGKLGKPLECSSIVV